MKKTPYLQSKAHRISKYILMWVIILFIICCLCGCAHKDPVENIIDTHQEHVNNVLEYAYNNIEQTADVKYLENELEHCSIAMTDIKQSYYGQIATCEAKIDYWRLATFGLGALFALLIILKIKRWF